MLLPSSIYEEMDRQNENFLWGSTEDKKKPHVPLLWS